MVAIPSFLSEPSIERNPVGVVRVIGCPSEVYIQDGSQAAILNDIKNLFDVHNPPTIPDLGAKVSKLC